MICGAGLLLLRFLLASVAGAQAVSRIYLHRVSEPFSFSTYFVARLNYFAMLQMPAETTQKSAPRTVHLSARLSIAVVLLVIVFFGLIRWRLRDIPLERDEGEYAYAGQLLLQGIPPYKLAYNMKLPGIYAAYAGMMSVFGETPGGIHIALLLLNAVTTLALYFLTVFLFGRLAAVAAASTYALLSTSFSVLGFEAHATNFVVLPAIVSILLLLRALQSGKSWLFVLSGLFSGVAFLMKQHGMFFVLFCLFYLVTAERKHKVPGRTVVRHLTTFAFGVTLPYAVTCWLLYQ